MPEGASGSESLRQRLVGVAAGLSALAPSLPSPLREACESVSSVVARGVAPQLGADSPLVISVTGGGSVGKSSVFGALAGVPAASPAAPRAGFTRRMVAAVPPRVARDAAAMETLFERFRANAKPRPASGADEASRPGDPVYVESGSLPDKLVLVDTPDFDTGSASGFANRDAAAEILSVSDVLLFVATNQTYNNKSGCDFLRSVLNEVGRRKVALLYRCSRRYPDETVREHMAVALSNLYPDPEAAAASCIGVWRIDESDDVAAGDAAPEIRPLAGGAPLRDALCALDPAATRGDVLRSAVRDAVARAGEFAAAGETERLKFAVWRDAMRYLASEECRTCLGIAPQKDLLALFLDEWNAAQPWIVRKRRTVVRGAASAAAAARRLFSGGAADAAPPPEPSFADAFRARFLERALALLAAVEDRSLRFDFPKDGRGLEGEAEAVRRLAETEPGRYELADRAPGRASGTCSATVARPPLASGVGAPGTPPGADPGALAAALAEEAARAVGSVESARPEVRSLVARIRAEMSPWSRVREIAGASLDTAAVIGTVTYVVATGDVFGGGSLLSMFGTNDLVAIPALGAWLSASGAAHRAALDRRMSALFTAWAGDKASAVRGILERGAAGAAIAECGEKTARLETVLRRLEADVAAARDLAARVFGPGETGSPPSGTDERKAR